MRWAKLRKERLTKFELILLSAILISFFLLLHQLITGAELVSDLDQEQSNFRAEMIEFMLDTQ